MKDYVYQTFKQQEAEINFINTLEDKVRFRNLSRLERESALAKMRSNIAGCVDGATVKSKNILRENMA